MRVLQLKPGGLPEVLPLSAQDLNEYEKNPRNWFYGYFMAPPAGCSTILTLVLQNLRRGCSICSRDCKGGILGSPPKGTHPALVAIHCGRQGCRDTIDSIMTEFYQASTGDKLDGVRVACVECMTKTKTPVLCDLCETPFCSSGCKNKHTPDLCLRVQTFKP